MSERPQFAAPPQRSPRNPNKLRCTCKKSLCLKLYCECFSSQYYCQPSSVDGDGCKCTDCNNAPQFEARRARAAEEIRTRNPRAFASGGKLKLGEGCNCKKTKCLKKYCECFDASRVCGDKCRCADCTNFDGAAEIGAEIEKNFEGLSSDRLHREVRRAREIMAKGKDLEDWIEEVRRSGRLGRGPRKSKERGADAASRGHWTEGEDERLRGLVARYGTKRWSKIAGKLPGRTNKSCRERWLNNLDPSISKSPWTEEEDVVLVQAIIRSQKDETGTSWVEISKLLPGRGDNSTKNRWQCLKKRVDQYVYDKDIDGEHKIVDEDGVYLLNDEDIEGCVRVARAQIVQKPNRSPKRKADEMEEDRLDNAHESESDESSLESAGEKHVPQEKGLTDGDPTDLKPEAKRKENTFHENASRPAVPPGPTISPYQYTHPAPPPPPWHEYYGQHVPHRDPNPHSAPELPVFKYKLITQPGLWDADKMGRPIGFLVGNHLQSSPANGCVSGVFHSNGLVSNDSGAVSQIRSIFGKLNTTLQILSASVGDILTMTIHVVDMHLHGDIVKREKDYFLSLDLQRRNHAVTEVTNNFAVTMVGVSGLMHVGALVQVEVSVVVRRAYLLNFEMQKV